MVYIAHTNFKAKLLNLGYASCIVSDSIDSTCPLITNTFSLTVSSSNIHDMQGIQAFSSLDNLFCEFNQLTSLPVLPGSLLS